VRCSSETWNKNDREDNHGEEGKSEEDQEKDEKGRAGEEEENRKSGGEEEGKKGGTQEGGAEGAQGAGEKGSGPGFAADGGALDAVLALHGLRRWRRRQLIAALRSRVSRIGNRISASRPVPACLAASSQAGLPRDRAPNSIAELEAG
jgi:hypothetical protein